MFQKGDTADTKVLRYERRKWDEFRKYCNMTRA